MLGFTGDFENPEASATEPRSVYLHGYVSSRIMRTATNGGTDSDEAGGGGGGRGRGEAGEGGMRVCVAATLFDGVVLALTPNHHSCNYRSAVVFGRGHVVTDEAERLWAMERVTDNLVPGRWAATRYPNAAEQRATGILRVDVESGSAKIRTGSTGEDRGDLKDLDMRKRVWAGVVPTHLVYGEPVPAESNMMSSLPGYLDSWRKEESEEAEKYAYAVAK